MNRETKKMLEARLAALGPAERRRLYKRALKLRKEMSRSTAAHRAALGKKGRRSPYGEWDDAPVFERSRNRPGESLDDCVLRLLLEEQERPEIESTAEGAPTLRTGTVVAISSGTCVVYADGRRITCILPPDIAAAQLNAVAVGDTVSLAAFEDSSPRIERILPRRTTLSRPDPHIPERERLIAANIDAVVIVVSVKAPPLRFRLIDRYLIATQRGGAKPILCVNKTDLLASEEERQQIDKILGPYREIGIRVVTVSASNGMGLADLQSALRGLRCVMVGRSGVGKSSLLNAICPDLDLKTATISEWSNKGKHTTTASALYELPGEIQIIDTPGIRQFGLWSIGHEELGWYFPEFERWASPCRFHDCTHTHEPDCGVKTAVAAGDVSAARYDTYLRIRKTLDT